MSTTSFLVYRGRAGVALSTESDPNTLAVDPTTTPIARVQPAAGSNPSGGNVAWFCVAAKGGTTADVQVWWWEATTRSWWPYGPKVTVTPAAPVVSDGGRVDGAPVYVQIVANTGVEQLGVTYS